MNRIDWNALDAGAREEVLQRPTRASSALVRGDVQSILEDVAARGDDALRVLTAHYDGVELGSFEVDAAEFASAESQVSKELRDAIEEAAGRIEAFHRAGMPQPYRVETADGVVCERVSRPINPVVAAGGSSVSASLPRTRVTMSPLPG